MVAFATPLSVSNRERSSSIFGSSQVCQERVPTVRHRKGVLCSQPQTRRACPTASTSRAKVVQNGVEAAVEDFIKTGMNICIGDGEQEILLPLVDAIEALVEAEGLIDVAFVGTNPHTIALLEERDLPSDMGVNFKRGIDLFIAPVTTMDADCNAVLDSRDLAADRYAAEVADQVVLIIQEDDLRKSEKGLSSVPVQLAGFLPEIAAEELCSASLLDVGVRGATLRPDGSGITDVGLASHARPHFVEEELMRSVAVCSIGLLPASGKTTVVVATNNLQPFDLTPPLQSLTGLSKESRTQRLTGVKREELIKPLMKEWRLIEGQQDALLRKFSFTSAKQAQAFVRYVHYVSSCAWHHPEIKQSYSRVQICLTTYDADGISELDAMFARELSRAYDGMRRPERQAVS